MKAPVVEMSGCTRCGVCVEVCPEVFVMSDSGYIFVAELDEFPESEVDEAIKNCPEDCISWEEQ